MEFYRLQSISEQVLLCLFFVYVFVSRVLPFVLAKFIQYKYKCSIRIGRVGLPLSLHRVSVKTADFCFFIERIGFTSSLVSSEAPKLLSVVITCVKVVKLTSVKSSTGGGSIFPLHKRTKVKAPPVISNLVQFLGIHINEIRLWGWQSLDDFKCLYCPIIIENVYIDGCTTVGGSQISACIVVSFQRCRARLIESWNPTENDLIDPTSGSIFHGKEGITIVECVFDFSLNLMFSPKNSGEFIDSLSIDIEKLVVWWELKAAFAQSMSKILQIKEGESQLIANNLESDGTKNLFEKIENIILAQLIPKDIKFRIFETECIITVNESKTDLDSKISGLTFASRCNVVNTNGEEIVNFESQFDLGLIRIEPDRNQSFSLDQFSNYIKLENNKLTIDIDFSQFMLRSFDRSLQFIKTRFISNLVLIDQFPKGRLLPITNVLESIEKITLESVGLELWYNTRSLNFSSASLIANCQNLRRIWSDSNSAIEVCIKRLDTTLKCIEDGHEVTYRPVSFEVVAFQLSRERITARFEGNKFEWVPSVEILLSVILQLFEKDIKAFVKRSRKQKTRKPTFLKGVNVSVVDCRLIYMAENNLCLNADVASFTFEGDSNARKFTAVGFEVFSSSTFSDCTLIPLFSIPKCNFLTSVIGEINKYDCSLESDAVMYWSPFIHKQILGFNGRVKRLLHKLGFRSSKTKSKTPTKSTVHLTFANASLIGKLAKNHAFEFKGTNWTLDITEDFVLQGNSMELRFDDHHIGQIEQFKLLKHPSTTQETMRYRKLINLPQKSNKVWLAEASKFCLTFPFDYNFASAFNDEFISCFKWLKTLHGKPPTSPPELWSDIVLKFDYVRIEIGDDPFEVKLRDNYELLEDEYYEGLKRNSVLETKINQLCKSNPLMSSAKFDDLRKQLSEKGSTIYIQRSKQLYKNHPIRTHLLLWELDSVLIVGMADPSMFGKECLKNIIKELNPESPWPTDGLEFSTLWCRQVRFEAMKWRVQLRDFPQPLMDASKIYFWGKFAAAETEASRRSRRSCEISIGGPFGSEYIERSLNGLKWYYDLDCEVATLSLAFGPCWEPVLAQCNLSFENIFPPSKDPSKPLPFWDKIRFLFHGRLYMAISSLTFFLHASLNPYNTTEEMEVTWTDADIAWNNAKIVMEGNLDIYVRTASKYDDCKLIHLPQIRLTFKLFWVCLADSNDHHSVQLCAPDRLPEYSSNQEHDSYRAFRSEHMNLNMSLDMKRGRGATTNPTASLFGSTLRWFENLKLILSGTTRPTRRGVLFKNMKPRKIPISRHYKKVRLSISLQRFHVCYWVSFSMQSGIELVCGKFTSSSEHQLALVPIADNLIHRPKADWSFVYVNSDVNDTEIWLQSSITQENTEEEPLNRPIEKFFLMSIDKLSYAREALLIPSQESGDVKKTANDNPQHRLVVHELKGAWTSSNRDVAFALFDSFVKVQQLKKNLSTEALRSFFSKHDLPSGSPRKNQQSSDAKLQATESPSGVTIPKPPIGVSPSGSSQSSSAAESLLQKLVSEVDSRGVVFSEDLSTPPPQQNLHGLAQCSQDDVIHKKWLIELVNCQVLLKGCETKGYVIVCSSKAHILQREHKPVWKHGTLVPKTSWVGTLEGMQYYATVSPGNTENIQWVTVENIEERDSSTYSNVPEMVGSGQSVGGVVSETVGESCDSTDLAIQLQRIISRCKCEFFYTSYGETGVDKIPSGIPDIPPAPSDQIWNDARKPVEAFTLMHHDLNVFTNSLQYAMVMDIVNNLVLYVDPKRKEGFDKLQRLRFKLQLQSTEAQRRPIQQLQNHLRSLVNQLRRLEKETYLLHRSLLEDPENEFLRNDRVNLEKQVNECKEQVAAKGEELHMMVTCYKEAKLAASQRLSRMRDNKDVYLVRVYEICFKQAQWRLTQTDGQLGIADLVLSNFLYSKTAKSDNCIEHLSELGYITVTNLLPNQMYKEVLVPSLIHASMPIDRQRTLRVFCRDRPSVGGIGVKDLFEINIAPITLGMTYQFFKTLFKFCFPEKDPEKLDDVDLSAPLDNPEGQIANNGTATLESQASLSSGTSTLPSTSKGKKAKKKKESKFYVSVEKDDVEKMKERADKNMLFIVVKIPEVPVKISYKGEKEKNIEDVHDVRLILPSLEVHNITWTWLDFLLAVRNHSKRALLSQVVKQKLWPKSSPNEASPQEEDKARMLLGQVEVKSLKKSLFGTKK